MDKNHLKILAEKTSYLNVLKDNVKPTKKTISPELVLISELMSSIPTDLDKVKGPRKEMEILRAAIIAEYDAINLYEQMAEITSNPKVKKVLLDIANEEKQHIGEFETLLKTIDSEHTEFKEKGEEEVENLVK